MTMTPYMPPTHVLEDRFYTISDKLLKHQKVIEEKLYTRENNLFNHNNSIYLYDLTNTYFEGLCKKNPKALFSKNQKEKRTDCSQIVIALVLDQEGFVRRHHIIDGKMSDAKSLEKIVKKIRKDFQGKEPPTLIMDRGISCDDNIKLVELYGLKYIVAYRFNEVQLFL